MERKSSFTANDTMEGLKILLERRDWSSLPHDILELIADRLGVIEFLSISSTCKDWRRFAYLKAADHHYRYQTKSSPPTIPVFLWFLLYGKGEFPNCALFDPSSQKVYNKINIPELDKGVECIASDRGWLLFYRDNDRSVFFFCPLSCAKIDLPNLPDVVGESFSRIAAFSSLPTSPDCIVCVCTQIICVPHTTTKIVVNLLKRGANEWDNQHEFFGKFNQLAGGATFLDGSVYFIDKYLRLASFSLEERQWRELDEDRLTPEWKDLRKRCLIELKYFGLFKGLNKVKLGLKYTDSLSICGTTIHGGFPFGGFLDRYHPIYCGRRADEFTCIINEEYKSGDEDDGDHLLMFIGPDFIRIAKQNRHGDVQIGTNERSYKGVWIQARFFQLPPNYSW